MFGASNHGGVSPSRNTEVKKAIRAAMAFGIPKSASVVSKGVAATNRQGDAAGLAGRQQGQGTGSFTAPAR